MAAKPKLSPQEWDETRLRWELDPRKPLSWLVVELNLPVSNEALRLRAKADGWVKSKLVIAKPKLGKSKPKLVKVKSKLVKPENDKPEQSSRNRTKSDKPFKSLAGELSVEVNPAEQAYPDASKLPLRWQILIEEYLVDLNGTQAAIRAGYSPSNAGDTASMTLAKPAVRAVVQARIDDRIEAIRMSRARVLDEFANLAEADANELSEHRRVCCRHCWGDVDDETGARAYQLTPAEYMKCRRDWEQKNIASMDKGGSDMGAFPYVVGDWFDKRKPINANCQECFGDGRGEVVLKDTRNISRRARAIYGGVKEGKDGIEIKTYSKEAALNVLAKHHKIYDESPQINFTTATDDALEQIYIVGVSDSEAAKARVMGRGSKSMAERLYEKSLAGKNVPKNE